LQKIQKKREELLVAAEVGRGEEGGLGATLSYYFSKRINAPYSLRIIVEQIRMTSLPDTSEKARPIYLIDCIVASLFHHTLHALVL
jgi:hypothetical protein